MKPNLSKYKLFRALIVWSAVALALPVGLGAATAPKDLFFQAENCARELRRSPAKKKYRDYWMRCIEQAQNAYQQDPNGGWAPAGLYLAADLYAELAHFSGRNRDRKEAQDLLERIVRKFPKSAYRTKAQADLKIMARVETPAQKAGLETALKVNVQGAGEAGRLLRSAEAAYRKLIAHPKWQMYRDRWMAVIDKYAAAHRKDPDGPAAATALFMSGRVYGELYGKSYISSDKKEALDLLARVVRRYGDSRYRQLAIDEMKKLDPKARIPATRSPSAPDSGAGRSVSTRKAFEEAQTAYNRLLRRPSWQKYRDKWQNLIERFDAVYRQAPTGPLAPAALFMEGKLLEELAEHSYLASDREKGLAVWHRLMEAFPESPYSRRAALASGVEPPSGQTGEPDDDAIAQTIEAAAEEMPTEPEADAGQGPATVTGLRYWSNPRYTRVVIDANRHTDFDHRLLKQDPALKKLQRLYVDLSGSRLGSGLDKTIPINDDLLKYARAGQFSADVVRVVIDIKSFNTYKIFSLRNPFRIVIDVWGEETAVAEAQPRVMEPGSSQTPQVGSLAAQLSLGVSRIAVDPGHGGKDYGAPGYLKGVHEKTVVLEIAKRLVRKIKKDLGCEAFLTRTDDTYLTLEERTAIANTRNADLFVSIHTNAVRDQRAYGVETYFLNLATDDDAIRVAARENATSRKNISDLQSILTDLMKNAKINESSRLAGHVQTRITRGLKTKYNQIRNKGVKQAPFYVLIGAQMPAILIETSFISNARECRRLISKNYQEHLCDGIVDGIRTYIKELHPTVISYIQHDDGEGG
ncbi:MAG: N-acetylmuramoyl-L-alanine amidase [Desulfobacterales bacterium]|nr:N-acetylmuramoyl-L-alanine amidase [Desulfobacterales bacterium]